MIIPAVAGAAGQLSAVSSEGLANGIASTHPEGLATGAAPAQTEGLTGSSGSQASEGVEGTQGTESGGFSGELAEAISSLEKTQQSSDSAAQALATGTVQNPESAVVTVEDAQMAMDLASQIRTKAAEAAQNIFQTQV
jgi:flagellar hook-basal body complex protein FliE